MGNLPSWAGVIAVVHKSPGTRRAARGLPYGRVLHHALDVGRRPQI